jgi:hypothetical protein
MWQKKTRKTFYTLNLNPDEYRDITDMTYPLMKRYCHKIGAEFYEINERKFPDWPPSYEKVQVYELGQQMENDWNIFFDCDAIIHPDTPDVTTYLPRDTVAHNAHDPANLRWRYDRFLLRDGRFIGSCTWICIASDWCIELFKPIDDLTLEDVKNNIFPVQGEVKSGLVEPERLIEDYAFSRNIAKYGLKYADLHQLFINHGIAQPSFFAHWYAIPKEEKVVRIADLLRQWRIT